MMYYTNLNNYIFIFRQLLNENGAELYMRSASDYVQLGEEISAYTLASSIYESTGEIFIGYRKLSEGNRFDIQLNLTKNNEPLTFKEGDRFIVLSTVPSSANDIVTSDELLNERFMDTLRTQMKSELPSEMH